MLARSLLRRLILSQTLIQCLVFADKSLFDDTWIWMFVDKNVRETKSVTSF